MTLSARSTEIIFRPKNTSSFDAVRLFLADNRWLDVGCQVGGRLLLEVTQLPSDIKDGIVEELMHGDKGRRVVREDELGDLSFQFDRRLRIGGKPLIHCFLYGDFQRVFVIPSEVVDAHYVHSYVAVNA